MPSRNLERRVEVMESQLEELKAEVCAARQHKDKDWKRAVDKYAGDPDIQAVFAQAMKLRAANRKVAKAGRHRARGKQG